MTIKETVSYYLFAAWGYAKTWLGYAGNGAAFLTGLVSGFVTVIGSVIRSTFFVRLAIGLMAAVLMLSSFATGHRIGYRHVGPAIAARDAALDVGLKQQSEINALKAKVSDLQKAQPAPVSADKKAESVPEKKAVVKRLKAKPAKKASTSFF